MVTVENRYSPYIYIININRWGKILKNFSSYINSESLFSTYSTETHTHIDARGYTFKPILNIRIRFAYNIQNDCVSISTKKYYTRIICRGTQFPIFKYCEFLGMLRFRYRLSIFSPTFGKWKKSEAQLVLT